MPFLTLIACLTFGADSVAAIKRKDAVQKEQAIYRGFDGRPITHTCRAEVDRLDGLKAALMAHTYALIGFKAKMRAGAFYVPTNARTELTRLEPTQIVKNIGEKLRNIDGAGRATPAQVRTAVLIYDTGVANGQYSSCVWLVSADGVEAAATVALPRRPLAESLRTGLAVTARAAARAPTEKGSSPSKRSEKETRILPTPKAPERDPAAQTDVFKLTLADAADLLLPPTVREKLAANRQSDGGPPRFNRLIILPAADLGAVPFAALPIGDMPLIDQVAIVNLPDIDALLGDDRGNPFSYEHQFDRFQLVVGNPDLSNDPKWKFQPLPGAEAEASEVARLVRSTALNGQLATKQRVLEALNRRPEIIYFATHGIADPVNPMDGSFLALKDGHLLGRDIKRLRSRFYEEFVNPLVVMSACQSGLGKVFEGGVFGLARAWHYAGAWQVVTSLWNIDDEATMALMTRFMTNIAQSKERRKAFGGLGMHGAEFDLRTAARASRVTYQDPALWAGFVLYGLPTIQ